MDSGSRRLLARVSRYLADILIRALQKCLERSGISLRRALVGALAAVLCALTLAVVNDLLRQIRNQRTPDAPEIHKVPPGETSTVTLADGTRMYLEGGTYLEVRRSLRAIEVSLHTGRVLFNVWHDKNRVFSVTTENARVEDLGTYFSVAMKDGRTSVALYQGDVEVVDLEAPDAQPSLLHGSGKVVVGGGTRDSDAKSAATSPRVFHRSRAPIGEWVEAFNEASVKMNIAVKGEAQHRRLGGTVDLNDPEKLIRQIMSSQGNPPLIVERDGPFVFIREKASR